MDLLTRSFSLPGRTYGRHPFYFADFILLAKRLGLDIAYDKISTPALLVRMLGQNGVLLSDRLTTFHACMALAGSISAFALECDGPPVMDVQAFYLSKTCCSITLSTAVQFMVPQGIEGPPERVEQFLECHYDDARQDTILLARFLTYFKRARRVSV